MNQCDNRIKELLPLYVDQELSKEEMTYVEQHVQICEECREELQMYQEIHTELNLDSIEAPKGFHEDLVSKLNALPKQSKVSLYKRYNKYINVAAMLVFVLLLSVVGLTQGNKWGQSSEEALMMTSESTSAEHREEAKMEKTSDSMEESMEFAMEESEEEVVVEEVAEESKEAEAMEFTTEEVADQGEMPSLDQESSETALTKELSDDDSTATSVEDLDSSNSLIMSETDVAVEADAAVSADAAVEAGINEEVFEDTTEVDITYGDSESLNESARTSKDTEVNFSESIIEESETSTSDYSLTQSKEASTEVTGEVHLQTESPKKKAVALIVYIFIFILSVIVGGTVFYYIRKRKLKN